jgi:phosphopantothenoylcysteine decarboxylase/phosphopantothenate--cysteine ligase
MGSALARTALLMGAEVIVVAGPSTVSYPLGAELRRVRTAEEMLAATLEAGQGCDLIIGAAAVADFRPAHPAATKIRKDDQLLSLQLVQNPDVIAQVAQRFGSAKVVAFAAEPSDDLTAARMKLSNKGLFAIAANDVSNPEIGFDAGVNELRLVFADGPVLESGRRSKLGCAIWMLQRLSADL